MQVGLRHSGWRTPAWRNARGGLCIPAAAKALPVLAERVGEGLPEAPAAPDPYAAPPVPAGAVSDTAVALPLEGLGPVTLDPVGTADGRWLWEAMVVRHSAGPVVVCTHVGPEHDGYRLHRAGWTCAGHGSGRRLAAGTVPVRPAQSAASPGSARVPVRCAVRQSGRSGNVVRAARQQ